MSLTVRLLLLLLGLGFSALCSATETALTALPLSRVELLTKKGGRLRRWAWSTWRSRPHRVLVSLLVLNNAANVGISALATELALALFGQQGLALAVGLTTLGLLVFGEVTPKTLARVNPESFAAAVVVGIVALDVLLVPLTLPLLGLSHLLARIRGTPLHTAPVAASVEDLRFLLSLSRQEGHLTSLQAEMLEAVLAIGRAVVREIQVPRPDVVMLPKTASLEEVKAKVLFHGFSRYPVYDGKEDNVVGILHARDLLRCHQEGRPWTSYLKSPLCVLESSRLLDVLGEMRARQLHLAVSIDEYGAVAGIVTLEDVLETIVGEIADEFDVSSPAVVELPSGGWIVKASLPLERLSRLTSRTLTSPSKVSSLGGLLLTLAGGVPEKGQSFSYQGLLFTVLEATPRRILKVQVESLDRPQA